MKKILFVATVQSHIAQFHEKTIMMLKEHGWYISIAARNNLSEKNGLQIKGADEVFDIPFERSPFSKKNLKAYRELRKIIEQGQFDTICCNTPVGGLLTRIAARKRRKKGTKVIYIAHGFHFYKGAPLKNWLIYYPIEKIMSGFTDILVTINEEDYRHASREFFCEIRHVHGVGIKSEKYKPITDQMRSNLREQLSVRDNIVFLCTGELNDNKNQITIIKAFAEVVKKVPNVKLLLAGNGPKFEYLKEEASKMKLSDNVVFLGYRTDLEKYIHIADVILSASKREGLGLNLIEGMYNSVPVIGAINRGHNELIVHGENGFLVEPNDYLGFAKYMIALSVDSDMRKRMGEDGYKKSLAYTDFNTIKEFKELYLE